MEHMVCYHHLQHPTCTGTDTCTALIRHSALINSFQPKKLSIPLCSHLTHYKLQLIHCIWTEGALNCQTPNSNSKPNFFKDPLIKCLPVNPPDSRVILLYSTLTNIFRGKKRKKCIQPVDLRYIL